MKKTKKIKGLAGMVAAAASTKNIKPRGRNLYAEFCFERDWAGLHSAHGTVGPGFFKGLREKERKFVKLEKKTKSKSKLKSEGGKKRR